jgi:RNA polymerase-associated protein CTR9
MAAATTNGHTNGINGTHSSEQQLYPRFLDIPAVIDIPVRGEDGDEAVNIDLTELLDETDELCDLLENENAAKNYWITIALAYVKQRKVTTAIGILEKGLRAHSRGKNDDRFSIMLCLAWLHMWTCRRAPRVKPSQPQPGQSEDEVVRTKDDILKTAATILNDLRRMNPAHPSNYLANGAHSLLKASILPSKIGPGSAEQSTRSDMLRQALKEFDNAIRYSSGRNLMATLGKAKVQYSLGNAAAALQLYQSVLERAPDMIDPDPRIGIGICLWTLGHKGQAFNAWQRSVELNPESVSAHCLLGLYWTDKANQYAPSDPEFKEFFHKAFTVHTQTAFKLDGMHPLTCAQFGSYFLRRRVWNNVERLARRAIEHTDVNAVASDGWYLLALQSHYEGDLQKATEHYQKADQARGGDERGYLPAKFGAAQLRTLMKDWDGAKFRLEKLVERSKSLEAMTLLGVLFAEDVFNAQAAGGKEDKSTEARRATNLLEQVRVAWRDPKRKAKKETTVLLNLARLYESDEPGKALACLKEAEEMLISEISDDDLPEEVGDDEEEARVKRELLPPQLLNNIGCFLFAGEKFADAKEYFQSGLNACVKLEEKRKRQLESADGEGDESAITALNAERDTLVTTMSYNLARNYEAEKLDEEAEKVYHGLLQQHPDYLDARMRLAYLSLKSNAPQGAETVKTLLESDSANLDVRALYGWHLHTAKKKTHQLNEDAEQRHFKHTLQNFDKHDLYSLTGMGNLHLAVAREMPRDTDVHKDKRSKMYIRAVEFFDKVLSLDPKNAFAAQGLGIAMAEDKKDAMAAVQIFQRVRESVKDEASVHVNLGHSFADVKQYARAIENYELALVKSRTREPGILACLGRVWLVKGRVEKKLESYKHALDFAKQALELAPSNLNYRFNVAFVQMQLAQMLIALPESQRTLEDVEEASQGLDEAIEAFGVIAKEPSPPFPRNDIEQRANMGRNTMKRQLAGVLERQAEYERTNKERIEGARKKREEEAERKAEQERLRQEEEEERSRKMQEERERIAMEDRAEQARRDEEKKAKEEEERIRKEEMYTTDEETGEKRKREKRKPKRRKRGDATDDDLEGTDAEGARSRNRSGAATGTSGTPATGSDGEAAPRRKTKKRKLETRKGRATTSSSKYKSADMVVESDEDDDGVVPAASSTPAPDGDGDDMMGGTPRVATPWLGDEDEEEDAVTTARARRTKSARVVEEDDEDEDQGVTAAGSASHGGDPGVDE